MSSLSMLYIQTFAPKRHGCLDCRTLIIFWYKFHLTFLLVHAPFWHAVCWMYCKCWCSSFAEKTRFVFFLTVHVLGETGENHVHSLNTTNLLALSENRCFTEKPGANTTSTAVKRWVCPTNRDYCRIQQETIIDLFQSLIHHAMNQWLPAKQYW